MKALIKLARKYDILIACDDVYNLLPFEDETLPKRLFAYDSFDDDDFKGNVVSNGTFSKLLSPGVRIGWMECAPRIVNEFRNAGVLKSGGAINNYTSGVVCSLIEVGLADIQLSSCLESYKAQCNALCETLDAFLPSSCEFIKPKGGYFIWIKLPETCDGDALSEFCLEKYKVFAIRGSRFSIENKFKNFIRLSFAFHPPATLREAGKKLCDGIAEYLK
jgi:DNA-binding transcriptional MocR family regulator